MDKNLDFPLYAFGRVKGPILYDPFKRLSFILLVLLQLKPTNAHIHIIVLKVKIK